MHVNDLYKNCCPGHGHSIINLSDDAGKYIDGLIRDIFKNQAIPDNDPELIKAYGTKLGEAIIEGYGSTPGQIDWNTPDYDTLTALQNNVWQFSAAKTHTQLRDMGKALIGPDGKVRSFQDFKIQAQQITNEQLNWLRTEYDTAIASAQMAAKWVTIQAQKKTLPLLEFDAVMDDRTSMICSSLNKVIRPVDDPFWKIYYPPNHFNCRSTVRQLKSGEITPLKDIVYPENMPAMFKTNLGQRGYAFPADHAYYKDVPAHIINNATLYMPPEEQYLTRYEAEDGTQLLVNRKTDIEQGSDFNDLMKAGKALADKGREVEILPVIHTNEDDLRNTLLPGVLPGKNPDLIVDGEYTEMKTAHDPNYAQLQNLIAKAVKQANRVIVLLDAEFTEKEMKAAAENRFKVFPDLEEIGYVTVDGEYIEFLNHKGQ